MDKTFNFINPGFYFKRRRDRINWRLLGSIDINRIQKELDLSALQDAIDNVTFCDIESEDLRYTDPNFVKLFQLAQLMIEYLLYCQNILQDTEKLNAKRIKEFEIEIEALKEQSEKQLLEIYTMKKENKSMKKTLYAYQMMSRFSGLPLSTTPLPPFPSTPSNLHAFPPSLPNSNPHHRCSYCPKVFQTPQFLQAHMERRHPDHFQPSSLNTTFNSMDGSSSQAPCPNPSNSFEPHGPDSTSYPAPTTTTSTSSPISHEELEEEINMRLQQQEKQQQLIDRLQTTMEELELKLKDTEHQLKLDMEKRMHTELDRKQKEMDQLLETERVEMQASLDALKRQLQSQVDQERALLETERSTLESLRQSLIQSSIPPTSHLGTLEDDPTSSHPNQEELLHQIEEAQTRALNSIQAFVAHEIHQVKDLLSKERESKHVQVEPQVPPPNIEPAIPVQISVQTTEDPVPLGTPSLPPKLHIDIPSSAPIVSVENLNSRRPSFNRYQPPAIPHTNDQVYSDDCDWERISKHFRSHKHVSLPYAPWIKSAVLHTATQVVQEREHQKKWLKQELLDRQITLEHLANESFFDQLVHYFEDQKEARHQADPSYGFMYDYLCEELERITAQQFKFRPKPTLMKKKNLSPHRHTNGGGVGSTRPLKGALKSSDHRGSVFRRVEWKEMSMDSDESDPAPPSASLSFPSSPYPGRTQRAGSMFASQAIHSSRPSISMEPTTPDLFRSKSYIPKAYTPITPTAPPTLYKNAPSQEFNLALKNETVSSSLDHFKNPSTTAPLAAGPSAVGSAPPPPSTSFATQPRSKWDEPTPAKKPTLSRFTNDKTGSAWDTTTMMESPVSPPGPSHFQPMKSSLANEQTPSSQLGSTNELPRSLDNLPKVKVSDPSPAVSSSTMQTLEVKSHSNNLSDWDVESL